MKIALSPYLLSELAAVTVTYNPDLGVLEQQLKALTALSLVVIVDNGSHPEMLARLRSLLRSHRACSLLELGENVGLAKGLNYGISRVCSAATGKRAILLLDQDSTFGEEAPELLLAALSDVEEAKGELCCIGPALHDSFRRMHHGFHVIVDGWRWGRAYPEAEPRVALPVASLNGSGTMMSLALAQAVGGLDDELFIDHVDTEWSFRVLSLGFGLYGIPWVHFEHRMGEVNRRIWLLGWRLWPERSPLRHFYLFRNTIRLVRRSYVPTVWKAWATMKLVVDVAITFTIDARRREQMRMMWKGFWSAMKEDVR